MKQLLLALSALASMSLFCMEEAHPHLPKTATLEIINHLHPRLLEKRLVLSLQKEVTPGAHAYRVPIGKNTKGRKRDHKNDADTLFSWQDYGEITSDSYGHSYTSHASIKEVDGPTLHEGALKTRIHQDTPHSFKVYVMLDQFVTVNSPEPHALADAESSALRRTLPKTITLSLLNQLDYTAVGPIIVSLRDCSSRGPVYKVAVEGSRENQDLAPIYTPHVIKSFEWEKYGRFSEGNYSTEITLAEPGHEKSPFYKQDVTAEFSVDLYVIDPHESAYAASFNILENIHAHGPAVPQ